MPSASVTQDAAVTPPSQGPPFSRRPLCRALSRPVRVACAVVGSTVIANLHLLDACGPCCQSAHDAPGERSATPGWQKDGVGRGVMRPATADHEMPNDLCALWLWPRILCNRLPRIFDLDLLIRKLRKGGTDTGYFGCRRILCEAPLGFIRRAGDTTLEDVGVSRPPVVLGDVGYSEGVCTYGVSTKEWTRLRKFAPPCGVRCLRRKRSERRVVPQLEWSER